MQSKDPYTQIKAGARFTGALYEIPATDSDCGS